MQKVEWPITIVQSDGLRPWTGLFVKNEFNAIPVTTPGSAIGRTSRNVIASRPKKRKRLTAVAAARPEGERDCRGEAGGLQGKDERAARILVVPRRVEPLRAEPRDRPALDVRGIEGIDADQDERDPEKQDHEHRPEPERHASCACFHQCPFR